MSSEWTTARAMDILSAAHGELDGEARELATEALAHLCAALSAPAVSGAVDGLRGYCVDPSDRASFMPEQPAVVSDPHNDSDMSVHCQQMGCQQLGIATVSDPAPAVAGLRIAELTGIAAHIRAVPAYQKLRGDADCIDRAIDELRDHARIVAENDARHAALVADYIELNDMHARQGLFAHKTLRRAEAAEQRAEAMAVLDLRSLEEAAAFLSNEAYRDDLAQRLRDVCDALWGEGT